MANAIQDRGARDIAKRALETVGQVFRYGIAHGYAKRNPATEIRPSDILKSIPKTTMPALMPRSCQSCSDASRSIRESRSHVWQ